METQTSSESRPLLDTVSAKSIVNNALGPQGADDVVHGLRRLETNMPLCHPAFSPLVLHEVKNTENRRNGTTSGMNSLFIVPRNSSKKSRSPFQNLVTIS